MKHELAHLPDPSEIAQALREAAEDALTECLDVARAELEAAELAAADVDRSLELFEARLRDHHEPQVRKAINQLLN